MTSPPQGRGGENIRPCRVEKAEPSDRAPTKKAKLSYKDSRRLEEIEKLLETLPAEIEKQDAILADPDLYSKNPAAFDKAMKAAEKARADLEALELEGLELEEKKSALS